MGVRKDLKSFLKSLLLVFCNGSGLGSCKLHLSSYTREAAGEKHGKELAQTRNNSARSQYAAAAEHACFRTDKEALKVAGCIMKGD